MEHIRKAKIEDVSWIAEILVFNKRVNYRPIFQNDLYSFGELQVIPVANEYSADRSKLENTWVYDDEFVKGLIQIDFWEIKMLYVDTFFQNQSIGAKLLEFAVKEKGCNYLWALEKNTRTISFYRKHKFYLTGEMELEEGTTEYLLKLKRQNK